MSIFPWIPSLPMQHHLDAAGIDYVDIYVFRGPDNAKLELDVSGFSTKESVRVRVSLWNRGSDAIAVFPIAANKVQLSFRLRQRKPIPLSLFQIGTHCDMSFGESDLYTLYCARSVGVQLFVRQEILETCNLWLPRDWRSRLEVCASYGGWYTDRQEKGHYLSYESGWVRVRTRP